MIRPYRPGDENAIALLEAECFSEPWSSKAIAGSAAEGTSFFVYEENGNVIAYAGLQAVCDEGYITNIAVSRSHRRKGIAKALLTELDRLAKTRELSFISLEVRESNDAAVSLYTACGYEKEGLRKNFYRSPSENALIMTKRRTVSGADTCN